MYNMLIVDDHDIVRKGIKETLADSDSINIKVLAEASNGEEAIKFMRNNGQKIDIVLMDISMEGIGGFEATRRILRLYPKIKIIVVSMHEQEPYPSQFLKTKVSGYISKKTLLQNLVKAIKTVIKGKRYVDAEIAQNLALNRYSNKESVIRILSQRELQVMMMIIEGEVVNDISSKLHLSPKTVNSYRYRIFAKLGVKNNVALTHLGMQLGMIETDNKVFALEEDSKET